MAVATPADAQGPESEPAGDPGVGPDGEPDSPTHGFSPLVSWLVATTRPAVTVELGPGDRTSLLATCAAVQGAGSGARCAAVLVPTSPSGDAELAALLHECGERFGPLFEGYATEAAGLSALAGAAVDLVHVALFASDEMELPDLGAWLEAMAPGATMVITTTAADGSSNFAKARDELSDRYPCVTISLGLITEAVVAQKPREGATPVVDLLRKAPFAVGAFLALSGDHLELRHLLGDEPESSLAVGVMIGRLLEQRQAERETLAQALRAHRAEAARLAVEAATARAELARQVETARGA